MADDRREGDPAEVVVALDDISATEWRSGGQLQGFAGGVVALDDISATEWRVSDAVILILHARCCTR